MGEVVKAYKVNTDVFLKQSAPLKIDSNILINSFEHFHQSSGAVMTSKIEGKGQIKLGVEKEWSFKQLGNIRKLPLAA